MKHITKTVNILSSHRKSAPQCSAKPDIDKHPAHYFSPLACFFNVSFFLFITPFRVKWNTNEGRYMFYANKLQTVRICVLILHQT